MCKRGASFPFLPHTNARSFSFWREGILRLLGSYFRFSSALMPPPSEEDLRVTARTLKFLDPSLTARELAKTLKKSHTWVLRWWMREEKENAPRGSGTEKTLTPKKLKFIKRKVCGTVKARGGVKKRKLSVHHLLLWNGQSKCFSVS